WVEGSISKESFQKRIKALDEQARDLRALMPADAAPALDTRRTVQAVVEYFTRFEDQPFAEQRKALRKAFREFLVDNCAIASLTLNGAFLGPMGGAKLSSRPRSRCLRRSRARAPAPRPT